MRGTMWVPARREKHIRREFYEKQRNHVGASFVAACMAVMQENGVDLSTPLRRSAPHDVLLYF